MNMNLYKIVLLNLLMKQKMNLFHKYEQKKNKLLFLLLINENST